MKLLNGFWCWRCSWCKSWHTELEFRFIHPIVGWSGTEAAEWCSLECRDVHRLAVALQAPAER